MDTDLFEMLGDTPESIIDGYRARLDAGFLGREVDFHFETGPSMFNALGDHGLDTVIQLICLAAASVASEDAMEGLLDGDDDTVALVDEKLEELLGYMMEMARGELRSTFRPLLVDQVRAGQARVDEIIDRRPTSDKPDAD